MQGHVYCLTIEFTRIHANTRLDMYRRYRSYYFVRYSSHERTYAWAVLYTSPPPPPPPYDGFYGGIISYFSSSRPSLLRLFTLTHECVQVVDATMHMLVSC